MRRPGHNHRLPQQGRKGETCGLSSSANLGGTRTLGFRAAVVKHLGHNRLVGHPQLTVQAVVRQLETGMQENQGYD
jgi:hypothetical protein